MLTENDIRSALGSVRYPGFSRDILSFGLVKGIQVSGSDVTVEISLATRDPNIPRLIHEQAMDVLKKLPGIGEVRLNFDIKDPPGTNTTASEKLGKSSIPGVKKIIAVASGKGGVGKSTVASNLAIALSKSGLRVGLCDCDLYGPSIALMFGTDERPYQNDEQLIVPIEKHGLQLISMGFLLEDASPVIVRGPVATRYTQQFLRQVAWDNLDVLVLDLPPGTGDIQLTIVQTVALDGALIVTTPQEVALIDARKAVSMFRRMERPITSSARAVASMRRSASACRCLARSPSRCRFVNVATKATPSPSKIRRRAHPRRSSTRSRRNCGNLAATRCSRSCSGSAR
jgi:ATP-binding protein involved in chromosome partitioning